MNAFTPKQYSIVKIVKVWPVVVPVHPVCADSYLILAFHLGYRIVKFASDVKSTIPHKTGRVIS